MFPIQDSVATRHPPLMTWLLIALNVLVFSIELELPPKGLEQVMYLFGIVPARFAFPWWAESVGFPVHTYWPFLTSMFLHAGWLHIIGNLWTLWIFGPAVEDQMGPVSFLGFYLVGGIIAGVVHVVVLGTSTMPTIGASGAIAAVMGAYLVMFPTARIVVLVPIVFFPLFFDLPAVFFLGWWLLLQIVSGSLTIGAPDMVGSIAFWAHVGGFVAGMSLCWLFRKPKSARRALQADEWHTLRGWSRGG